MLFTSAKNELAADGKDVADIRTGAESRKREGGGNGTEGVEGCSRHL